MTNEPRKPQNERDFERDLESLQSAWNRMDGPEPPDLLDQAVMNAARRDIEPVRKRRPMRWLGAFATATVVVLALTLVLEQEQQAPVPAMNETDNLQLQRAPMRAAEPRAMARESKREKQSEPAERESASAAARDLSDLSKKAQTDRLEFSHTLSVVTEEAPRGLSETAAAAEAPSAAPLHDEEPLDAETWIHQMLTLREKGELERLAEELAAFRNAYPDHGLPAELAELEP